jgi:hypothetical protein
MATPTFGCFITMAAVDGTRVARWFVFKPKIPIWDKFSVSFLGKC